MMWMPITSEIPGHRSMGAHARSTIHGAVKGATIWKAKAQTKKHDATSPSAHGDTFNPHGPIRTYTSAVALTLVARHFSFYSSVPVFRVPFHSCMHGILPLGFALIVRALRSLLISVTSSTTRCWTLLSECKSVSYPMYVPSGWPPNADAEIW